MRYLKIFFDILTWQFQSEEYTLEEFSCVPEDKNKHIQSTMFRAAQMSINKRIEKIELCIFTQQDTI